MIQPPINNLLLSLKSKWIGDYSNIIKASHLNPSSKLNVADLVQIVGEIVGVPRAIADTPQYKGFTLKDIEVGDMAIFRYDVVWDIQMNTEGENFFRNMIWYKGREYFLCDISKLFGVIKKENQSIKMLNGYVMLTDIEKGSQIYVPQHLKRIARAKEATLEQIGNTLENQTRVEAFPGDRVLVNPFRIQHYVINDKKFGITKQSDIFGRVLN